MMTRSFLSILLLCCTFALPANAQEIFLKMLEKSPRHHEWVQVPQGDRKVRCFLVFPEVATKATAVVVIHENRGLTEWVRLMADQLAEAGYIAIAPDLLSGAAPNGGGTDDFENGDQARQAIYTLSPEQVAKDLEAVRGYVAALPAANGKTAVTGFCWGGSQSFRMATNSPDLKAALVFYGTGPEEAQDIARIKTPVYGFYGGNDQRVNATIPTSERLMKEANKTYEYLIYEGAGHGFMRAGQMEDATPANKEGWLLAFEKIKSILSSL